MTQLLFYKTNAKAHTPKFATAGSACFDLSASLIPDSEVTVYSYEEGKTIQLVNKFSALTIAPFDRVLIPTNLILDIPDGFSVRLHPRSGLALKNGLTLANSEGVIDSDYVDPLFVMLYNISGTAQQVSDGDRICQAELVKNETFEIRFITEPPKSKSLRSGGFGSTGVQ